MSPLNRYAASHSSVASSTMPAVAEVVELGGAEPEVLDQVEQAPGAADHAVAAAVGQPPREHLEHRLATQPSRCVSAACTIVSSYWSVRSAEAVLALRHGRKRRRPSDRRAGVAWGHAATTWPR